MAKTWLALPRVHCQPFCHNSNRIPSSKNLKKGCGLTSKREKENPLKTLRFQGIGAAAQIRTGDLILTKYGCVCCALLRFIIFCGISRDKM